MARPGATLDEEVLRRDTGSITHDPALHAVLNVLRMILFILQVQRGYDKSSQHTSTSGNTQAAGMDSGVLEMTSADS